MTISKTILKRFILLFSVWTALPAALLAAPTKTSLPLPMLGKKTSIYATELSDNSERVCIVASDSDSDKTKLLLVNRSRQAVEWQAPIPVPGNFADIIPVQCVVASDRVYLLAHVDTSTFAQQTHTLTYVSAFDMTGKRIANTRIDLPGFSQYGYAIAESTDGLKVSGSIKDKTDKTESYATYTVTLDASLRQHGTPLIRKNGAFALPYQARIIGNNTYIAGRFFGASVSTNDIGVFSASRLRNDSGYLWSVHTLPQDPDGVQIGIADDGTSYSIGSANDKTLLSVVSPDGKAAPLLNFKSNYCRTGAITRYGHGAIAIRQPCDGGGSDLVVIDTTAGTEKVVKSPSGTPLSISTKGNVSAIVSRDESGKVSVYFVAAGEL